MTRTLWHRTTVAALTSALAVIAASCSSGGDAGADPSSTSSPDPGGIEMVARSSRPDMVSGDDMVVGLDRDIEGLTFGIEGSDIELTATPRPGPSEHADRDVLLSGLPPGSSTIVARSGDQIGELRVTAHPDDEPAFSGPHAPLATCTTQNFEMGDSSPPDCAAEPRITWTELGAGGTGPVWVREENRVINRSVATIDLAVPRSDLPDDTDPEAAPDISSWNGRIVYRFGGGCGTTYSQGFDLMGEVESEVLEAGYLVATATFNTFQVACNDVLSAETTMRVKEYISETYGVPVLTIGSGGSGGAIQQLLIAQNYPGLLDAIGPMLPFPDAVTISGGVVDCALLGRYTADRDAPPALTTEQFLAVAGHLSARTCDFWEQTFVPGIDPGSCGFGDGVTGVERALPGLEFGVPVPPADQIYDSESNPDGLRCTLQDSNVNIFGTNPDTGFANRPWSNEGVQYGLNALNSGAISWEQFLDLNENIGSFDIDGQWQSRRAAADDSAIAAAYRSGRVLMSESPLLNIPVILTNLYTDPEGDIHDRFRMFSIADRLSAPNGDQPPGLVMWTQAKPPETSLVDSLTGAVRLGPTLVETLDEWATALAETRTGQGGIAIDGDDATDLRAAMGDTRPEGAVNTCFAADGTVTEAGDDIYAEGAPCADRFPMGGDPRTEAGAPRANDLVECARVDIDEAIGSGVYADEPTDDVLERLRAAFPDGVCDWSTPGPNDAPWDGPWQSFT